MKQHDPFTSLYLRYSISNHCYKQNSFINFVE